MLNRGSHMSYSSSNDRYIDSFSSMRKGAAWALVTMWVSLSTVHAQGIDHTLFDFRGRDTAEGWRTNIYGKDANGKKGGGSAKAELVAGRQQGEHALRLSTTDAGSCSFSPPSPPEDGVWRGRKYFGIEVSFRGDGVSDLMNLRVNTPEGQYAIALRFDGKRTWQTHIYRSGWARAGTPPLDWSKITHVYFGGGGTKFVDIEKIALVGGVKRIPLAGNGLPTAVAPPTSAAPQIDGVLDDAVWAEAGHVDGLFLKDKKTPSAYAATVKFLYRGSMLFIGARLRGEKPEDIAARYKNDEEGNLYDDSCLEVYLDAQDSNRLQYKFIANSLGTRMDLGGEGCRPLWNGEWDAAATVDTSDGWSLELAIDLASIEGAKPEPGAVWGLNLKRHVVSAETGKFLEVSGWSQTSYGRPAGLGNLVFGPLSPAKVEVTQSELLKLEKYGYGYNCRLLLENGSDEAETMSAVLALTPPGETAAELAGESVALRPTVATEVSLPFEYEQTRDGNHLLNVIVRDAEGHVAVVKQFTFLLTRPRELDYDQVVLWPPPQVWKPGKERWLLPKTTSLTTTGKGEAFPAEHLSAKFRSRYGVTVERGEADKAAIKLEYVAGGIKPEGFVLDIDSSGVRLQAVSSRGMYYAVRALLDLTRQSSFAKARAGILHVHCEDFPAIPMRVYMETFISQRYHKTPLTVESYKKHIYDQVAGGRYSLYVMQISEHVRYDSHPELAPGNVLSKKEVKEIVEFARKHYVDVAPGWNTPGHCGWLVHAHPELSEDGDKKTLCTSNPEGMRILKDLAGELLDLYQPAYFFMSGDEVSHGWNRTASRTCTLCSGKPRNQLLLKHWSELAHFFAKRGVKPVIFDDMLSVSWNGGAPYHVAKILPELPRNLIIATWGSGPPFSLPTDRLRELGFTPWWVSTAFASGKMDRFPAMWEHYEACGIAETTTWVWSNFVHFDSRKQTNYSTPSLHANAACCWKPDTAPMGHAPLMHAHGVHWSNVMSPPDWGVRELTYRPLPISKVCNESTRDATAGDGKGWMDSGPDRDLRSLPSGMMSVGGIPFDRPEGDVDCIVLRGQDASRPINVERPIRGLAFLHTAAADAVQTKALHMRFFRQNTDGLAMPVARYRVRYADGTAFSFPVRLGHDVHLWDCGYASRIMPGPSTYWMGLTTAQRQKDPNAPDVCAWVMEWVNPFPETPVLDVTFVAAGTEATVVCLGLATVERVSRTEQSSANLKPVAVEKK
mgnify:FL=1|jgi:hypothetical protein